MLGKGIQRVRNETLETFPYFVKNIKGKTSSHTRITTREYSIFYIIKILHCLENRQRNFSELYMRGGIGMKSTHIKYLNLCLHFKFIQKEKGEYHNETLYSIAERGKILLDLFNLG